jgi:hypothetical protein
MMRLSHLSRGYKRLDDYVALKKFVEWSGFFFGFCVVVLLRIQNRLWKESLYGGQNRCPDKLGEEAVASGTKGPKWDPNYGVQLLRPRGGNGKCCENIPMWVKL